jgi:hypothetical protein
MDKSKVLEFYEHRTKIDPNYCEHIFKRLAPTRVVCKKCGLGFYDNPMNPFPIDEVNAESKRIIQERKERDLQKENKDIEKQ